MTAPHHDRARGLRSRHLTTTLALLAVHLLLIVAVLQLMVSGSSDASDIGVTGARTATAVPHGGEPCAPRGFPRDGEACGEDRGDADADADAHVVVVRGGGKMDASQYLLGVKQMVARRLACHGAFVADKKYALVMVLWEVIEGVYELEEGAEAEAASSFSSFSSSPSSMHGAAGGAASGTSREEVKVVGFRQEVEARMQKSDFEGVMKMAKSGLGKAGATLGGKGKFTMQGGSKGEEHFDARMKMVGDSTTKVTEGLSAAWDILREMEEEMKDLEAWLRGMEGVLGEVVAEFLEAL
ncbi:hypothetical protein EYC84_010118 [Monilinia fructicola]|uniref:Uncharacterized protein n=2 Tax=Monilinia fructicola TaxID=38448 RepID=A0A5M9JFD4_MONFR|nr:hypothetical protein EYC84_010118 [Monilinia fructicola]